ncbi:unnamed protein product [Closterium sp. Yama58-4]|nr:unnamed protein product [Closterium sp. Yama58-4]
MGCDRPSRGATESFHEHPASTFMRRGIRALILTVAIVLTVTAPTALSESRSASRGSRDSRDSSKSSESSDLDVSQTRLGEREFEHKGGPGSRLQDVGADGSGLELFIHEGNANHESDDDLDQQFGYREGDAGGSDYNEDDGVHGENDDQDNNEDNDDSVDSDIDDGFVEDGMEHESEEDGEFEEHENESPLDEDVEMEGWDDNEFDVDDDVVGADVEYDAGDMEVWGPSHFLPRLLLLRAPLPPAPPRLPLGILASATTPAGSPLASIPFPLWLSRLHGGWDFPHNRPSPPPPPPYKNAGDDVTVAAWLLREWRKGKDSFYSPWINLLPGYVPLPVFWDEATLGELDSGEAIERVEEAIRYVEEAFSLCSDESVAGASTDEFKWAVAIVWSRSVPISAVDWQVRLGTCRCLQVQEGEQPFPNLFNHEFYYTADWQPTIHSSTADINIFAADVISPGQPISVGYGSMDTAQFLLLDTESDYIERYPWLTGSFDRDSAAASVTAAIAAAEARQADYTAEHDLDRQLLGMAAGAVAGSEALAIGREGYVDARLLAALAAIGMPSHGE